MARKTAIKQIIIENKIKILIIKDVKSELNKIKKSIIDKIIAKANDLSDIAYFFL